MVQAAPRLTIVFRDAPVTLALSVACLLLACAGAPAGDALAWDRAALLQGEIWRLWSGHLDHFSGGHAVADVLCLLAMGWVAEPMLGTRRFALSMAAAAPAISLALFFAAPGLATMAAALAGVLVWRRHRGLRGWVAAGCLGLVAKTGWEASNVAALFAGLPAGVVVAWQAHAAGALLGLIAGAVPPSPFHRWRRRTSARRPWPAQLAGPAESVKPK